MSLDQGLLLFREKYGRHLPVGWYRQYIRPLVLSLDALVVRVRRKYEAGPRVVWYRDHVRPRILLMYSEGIRQLVKQGFPCG